MQAHALIAIPLLAFGLAGTAAAQPASSTGGAMTTSGDNRPDSGAPPRKPFTKDTNQKRDEGRAAMTTGTPSSSKPPGGQMSITPPAPAKEARKRGQM